MNSLKFKTADGETHVWDWQVARKSVTIRDMLETLGIEKDSVHDDAIPLPNNEISGPVFKKVKVWCEKNKDLPDPKNDDEDDMVNIFYKSFTGPSEPGGQGGQLPPPTLFPKIEQN